MVEQNPAPLRRAHKVRGRYTAAVRLHSERALVIPSGRQSGNPWPDFKIRILAASTSTPILGPCPQETAAPAAPRFPASGRPASRLQSPRRSLHSTRLSFSPCAGCPSRRPINRGMSAPMPSSHLFPPPSVHVRTAPSAVTCTSREVANHPPTPASFAPSLIARRWLLPSPHTPADADFLNSARQQPAPAPSGSRHLASENIGSGHTLSLFAPRWYMTLDLPRRQHRIPASDINSYRRLYPMNAHHPTVAALPLARLSPE